MTSLTERIQKGIFAIHKAKAEGKNTAEWEKHLNGLIDALPQEIPLAELFNQQSEVARLIFYMFEGTWVELREKPSFRDEDCFTRWPLCARR